MLSMYVCMRMLMGLCGFFALAAAAKQAAFEEANKIKNQFRALDDDEIDFLDEVKARARREEERLRRETEEGLGAFRKEQLRLEKEASAGGDEEADGGEGEGEAQESWGGGRKRKRREERAGVIKGVKRRTSATGEGARSSQTTGETVKQPDGEAAAKDSAKTNEGAEGVAAAKQPPAPAKSAATTAKLGLVDYGSDSDDD